MNLKDKFLEQLTDAIDNDRLTLPTLPEVALRVRDAVNNPDVGASELASVISEDAALAARIIKVANSPLLRGRVAVDNLQLAVSRLGLTFIRNLTTGLAMEQMFKASSADVDKRLRQSWEHSKEVASICSVLTTHYTKLKADQSLLAGLVHEIGILPILTLAEENKEVIENQEMLEDIIQELHPQIGHKILQAWDFPEEIASVPLHYQDLSYDSDPGPDYSDIVLVANLQSSIGSQKEIDPELEIPAFEKLGLSMAVDVHDVDELAADITEAQQLLS